MDEDRIEGSARNIGGTIKEGVGAALGDTKTQAEGRFDQIAGKAQNAVGSASDTLDDVVDLVRDYPISSIAVVGFLGFLLGRR